MAKTDIENAQDTDAIGVVCSDLVRLELVSGVEGRCLVLNDRRIAGPKPWGGGTVQQTWEIPVKNITDALPCHEAMSLKHCLAVLKSHHMTKPGISELVRNTELLLKPNDLAHSQKGRERGPDNTQD